MYVCVCVCSNLKPSERGECVCVSVCSNLKPSERGECVCVCECVFSPEAK